jgi:hypothetical protein
LQMKSERNNAIEDLFVCKVAYYIIVGIRV